MTTIDNITDEQIETLRSEAATAGDLVQVDACTDALSGDVGARQTCVAAIREAEAQHDVCPVARSL